MRNWLLKYKYQKLSPKFHDNLKPQPEIFLSSTCIYYSVLSIYFSFACLFKPYMYKSYKSDEIDSPIVDILLLNRLSVNPGTYYLTKADWPHIENIKEISHNVAAAL